VTVRVIAIIAAEESPYAARVLAHGDRAAVALAVSFAPGTTNHELTTVFYPWGDNLAACYAQALGATPVAWDGVTPHGFDLAIIGPGAIDRFGDELAGQLAESFRATLLFDVLECRRELQGWSVLCDAGRGARERIEVVGPVVLVMSADVARPRYVSRYRLSLARSAVSAPGSSEVKPASDRRPAWELVTPRVSRRVTDPSNATDAEARTNAAFGIGGMSHERARGSIVTEDAATCAEILLRYLVHHGFVERPVGQPDEFEPRAHVVETGGQHQPRNPDKPDGTTLTDTARKRGPRVASDSLARIARRPRRLQT
jgi:electron transfer flavoprotein alpha/beta subunit